MKAAGREVAERLVLFDVFIPFAKIALNSNGRGGGCVVQPAARPLVEILPDRTRAARRRGINRRNRILLPAGGPGECWRRPFFRARFLGIARDAAEDEFVADVEHIIPTQTGLRSPRASYLGLS